ncbi:MAG: HAD-IA family hydrolase [Aquificae bacterium]|nr:HAD-IA family hydrolase [Aquificota bacterium]
MNFKAYFFDLDGTLIDSSKDIAQATNYTLQALGYSPMPEEEIMKHVGYGGRKLLEGVLGKSDQELIDRAVSIFREYYFENPVVYTQPYPNAVELLEKLKKEGKKLAVITNKYENVSKEILKKLGLNDYIDMVIGGDSLEEKKPSPKPVLFAIESFGDKPKDTLMIGDSETDIISGKKANTKTCLVTFGYGKKDLAVSYKPDYIISSLKEVLTL